MQYLCIVHVYIYTYIHAHAHICAMRLMSLAYLSVSLGGFSVIPSSHVIYSIPTTRYWCCQNTEIPWLLGIAKIPRMHGGKYRPLGIPKIPRLRWIRPNHKNRGIDVHRPSLQNTRYRYSGVWMSFVWSTHHSLSGAACCNPILVSLPVNYQGLRSFADAGQVGTCGFPYQVRGLLV